MPPGTTTMSGSGRSSSARSATILSIRLSVAIGPGSAATNVTRAPGSRLSVSYGPMASSAVKRSNSGMAMSIVWVLSGGEPLAVGGGVDAHTPAERSAHGLDGAEAAVRGDGLDGKVGGLELTAGALDARGLDVCRGRHTGLRPERAGEVALAHVGAGGQRGHGEVGGGVL